MQLVTRAALGWPASAAPDQPTALGVKIHYEGTPVSTNLLSDHAACLREWQNIRASHLANTAEGYVDVAYNYAACPHGYLLEGRGIGKRTGANGNQTLNRAHYAIVGLVGSEGLTQPTDQMLNAIRDGIDLLRAHGAGSEVRGHRDGYATDCPGGPLYAWVQAGAPRPTTTNPVQEDDMLTDADVQKLLATKLPDVYANPAHGGYVPTVADAINGGAWSTAAVAALSEKVDSLAAKVAALASDGGVTQAQLDAAAQAGARAALAALGAALPKGA